ncbi:MAG: hypothetical protein AB4426_17555 [Xenococcaceae cyanobacterium]
MTNNDPNRLDRIEVLIEKIGQRVDSNARTIEALTDNMSKWQQEWQLDRSRLYQAMSELAVAQGSFYHRLEDVDKTQRQLSNRQGEIVEILKLLTNQDRTAEN